MPFVFRLRAATQKEFKLAETPARMNVPGIGEVEVRQANHHVTFIGRGFESEEAARSAGQELFDAVLIAGAKGAMGFNAGHNRETLNFHPDLVAAMEDAGGKKVKTERLGLMVYEQDTVAIIAVTANVVVSASLDHFEADVRASIGRPMSERQKIAASLLNDAERIANNEARFVVYVSAVEALCDQHDLGPAYQAVVDHLLQALATFEGEDVAKETLKRALEDKRRKSIRQAYMSKISGYLGNAKAREFHQHYQKRSAFVHDGVGRGTLDTLVGQARQLAVDLLLAEVASNETRSDAVT